MWKSHISYVAAASVAVAAAWAPSASAQQPPGSNAPTPAPADPDGTTSVVTLREPVIDTTTERTSYPNTPLLTTGLVVLGGSYGASAITAATYADDRDWYEQLYYPVAGPWMALDERDCNVDHCDNEDLGTVLLIGSGVLQGIGALSTVLSFIIPEKETQSWYLIGNEDVVVAPMTGKSEVGAVAVGRF